MEGCLDTAPPNPMSSANPSASGRPAGISQLRSDSERVESDNEQIEKEIEQLRRENAREKALSPSIRRLCLLMD
jgi:hypothetical protein